MFCNALFAVSDKRKYIKNRCAGKKRNNKWNKPAKSFPNK